MNNKKNSFKTKTVALLLVFVFLVSNLAFIKNANAVLGFGDITFNTTIGDIPALILKIGKQIADVFFQKYKKKLVTMATNDIINYVQNDTKPRFVKDFKKFLGDAADQAAGEIINDTLMAEGVNICSPFKASLSILVNRAQLGRESQTQCTLGAIANNLEAFADNFNNGGWKAWVAMHEETNNLPDVYSQVSKTIRNKKGNTLAAAGVELTTAGGFLGKKVCSKSTYHPLVGKYTGQTLDIDEIRSLVEANPYKGNFTAWFDSLALPSAAPPDSGGRVYRWSELFKTDFITFSKEYNPPTDTLNFYTQLGETCASGSEEIETPGKIIADTVSNTLQKVSMDSLVDAQELSQFLNTLIDAATNRVLREGLSYVKTGRGAFTKPQRGGGKKTTSAIKEQPGLEGPKAIAVQNQLFDLRNKSQQAQIIINKLVGKTDKKTDLEARLDYLTRPGNLDTDIAIIDPDLSGKHREGKPDDTTADIIDQLYTKIWYGDNTGYPFLLKPKIDFNLEENNPGVYIANQVFYQKISELWEAIMARLEVIDSDPRISSIDTNKCVPNITFTLNPERDDLPFLINSEGIKWVTGADRDNYNQTLKNVVGDNVNTDDVAEGRAVNGQDWKVSSLSQMLATAEQQKENNKLIAESYVDLIKNTQEQKTKLDENFKYSTEEAGNINLYTSLLLDYDRAGSANSLSLRIKNYQDALAGRYKVSIVQAKSELGLTTDTPAGTVDPLATEVTDDMAVEVALLELRRAQSLTRAKWAQDQRDITGIPGTPGTAPENSDEWLRATKKLKIIIPAIELIYDELEFNLVSETRSLEQALGTSPSDAVGQIMQDTVDDSDPGGKKFLPQPLDQILEEIERRAGEVEKLKTDLNNTLGRFITDRETRIETGIDSGDNEWEKYFYNRFQYGYAGFIYDYFARDRFQSQIKTCP